MTDEQPMELHGRLKGISLGPCMQACNERERIFAFAYGTGIATSTKEAARLAGYSEGAALSRTGKRSNSLNSRGHQLLHKPRVMAAIEEVCRTEFRNLIPITIAAAKRVLLDPDHKDHAKTVMGLLSRLGYGEKTQVDVNVSGQVVVDHTTAALDDLRTLKALGVAREKLIETFGFSGLDRYEKLLAERDGQMKVIEHQPIGAVEETT